MIARLKKRWWALALGALLVGLGLWLFFAFAYTPTTTATVVNDSPHQVLIDDCSDAPISIAPGGKAEVEPFVDRPWCRIFFGDTNFGTPAGCIAFPTADGHTVFGSVARVSQAVPFRPGRCRG